MSAIQIRLSQSVVDKDQQLGQNAAQLNGSLGAIVDAILVVNYKVSKDYDSFSSWSFNGSTLKLGFPDGATITYTGVVLSDPSATSGSATARGAEFYKNGLLSISETGLIHLNYVLTRSTYGDYLKLDDSPAGASISAVRLATMLPLSDQDPDLGDVAIVLAGAIQASADDMISGKLSRITLTADKYLLSTTIEGDFDLAANALTVGQQLSHASVSGTLYAFRQEFRDGSYARITNLATELDASQQFDYRLFADGSRLPNADNISIDMPSRMYEDLLMASGAGDDWITIKGGGGRLHVDAGDGNDHIGLLSDSHIIDGGTGTDMLNLTMARSAYLVERTATGYQLTDPAGAASSLVNMERITFTDTAYALDISGNGGQAYRLYQAAFNRVPDAGGLGFWIHVLDNGTSLNTVASGFVDSAEFMSIYGAALSNRDLVSRFYENILHRTPEVAGLEFWTNVLDTNAATRYEALAAISESEENQAGLIGTIGNGFPYIPYG